MINRIASILSSNRPNKPWALYHLLYFEYRYRFVYQYREKNPVINLQVPEYLMTGNAFNTTQIFLFNLSKKRRKLTKKMGRDQYRFYVLKMRQQLKSLAKTYSKKPHTIYGINPKNGLVHPLDLLETQRMARDFSAVVKRFPFSLKQLKDLRKLFYPDRVSSIIQGVQITDDLGGTTFLIKVKEFMIMYYEVPGTKSLNKREIKIHNQNVKVNLGSQSKNVDLQTHLFDRPDQVRFLYGELKTVGQQLQSAAKSQK